MDAILRKVERSEYVILAMVAIGLGAVSTYLHQQDITMLAHSDKI
ncbi:MAG TPA: hypothetical protein VMS71_00215 [Candidatus Acidoferrum sp.]|nr:hypothetical protein [Candidatus Acidoferrum sp.]